MAKLGKLLVICIWGIAISSLYGCNKRPLVLLVANDNVDMYKSHKTENQKADMIIKPGDTCVTGDSVIEKAFQYTEVLCRDAGYGWVADMHLFKKIEGPVSD